MVGSLSRMVRRPSRMSGSGREALPDVREGEGSPPGCAEVVGRPSRMIGIGREAILDVRDWSEEPTEMSEVYPG